MKKTDLKHPKLCFYVLLALGLAGLIVPGIPNLPWGSGLATALWILVFLNLTCTFRSRRERILTAVVFCAGYLLRFYTTVGTYWLFLVLFPLTGLVLYGIFLLYSYLINIWNRLFVTLAFPAIWMLLYFFATLLRFPTLLRIDVAFLDMSALFQSETLISSFGLSFFLLWIFSLLHFAFANRKIGPGALGALFFALLLTVGIVRLYPAVTYETTVRVAYTTGPYCGDFLNYSDVPLETSLASMENAARQAAEQHAEILVFNEESFDVYDREEEPLLAGACKAAGENGIHLLIGMDVTDTDGSEAGKSLNKLVWIGPDGEILGTYLKTKLIPAIESGYRAGEGSIPSQVILHDGREVTVSYLICYDSNFPEYVRRMDSKTDILILPSWDWGAVTYLHGQICRALAVENHVSLLKCTYDGISLLVDPHGEVLQSSDTAVTGYEQVQIAEIPVGETRLAAAGTQTMLPSVAAILAVEVMSILCCCVLLYGNVFENKEKSLRNRVFSILVATCILALVSDALSWVLDGRGTLTSTLYSTTILAMVITFVLTLEFVTYLTVYVREHDERCTFRFLRLYSVFTLAAIVFTLVLSLNGSLFSYENGAYSDGPAYAGYVMLNALSMLLCLVIVIVYRKSLGTHDLFASFFYIFFPCVAAAINLLIPDFSYAYPATALSMTVVYVMIQSEQVSRLKKHEEESDFHAHHDELTGLPNRRAFDEKLQAVSAADGMVGVIFADVNGLKFTNDSLGHEAGDRLLLTFTEILSDSFRKEEIFRVSGDEFVIVMAGLPQEYFAQRIEKLGRDVMLDSTEIACIGTEYGACADIKRLIKTAEFRMYAKKVEFHKTHPEMSR